MMNDSHATVLTTWPVMVDNSVFQWGDVWQLADRTHPGFSDNETVM